VSTVTVNTPNIQRFFAGRPLAGVGAPGLRTGNAERIAERMVRAAIREVTSTFNMRTGELVASLVPIVRIDPRTGAAVVGVGSTVPYSEHLEKGTSAHPITPKNVTYLMSNGPRSKGPNPTPLRRRQKIVSHPGNQPYGFLRKARDSAIGRGI
jgi:hypothetical protein